MKEAFHRLSEIFPLPPDSLEIQYFPDIRKHIAEGSDG